MQYFFIYYKTLLIIYTILSLQKTDLVTFKITVNTGLIYVKAFSLFHMSLFYLRHMKFYA